VKGPQTESGKKGRGWPAVFPSDEREYDADVPAAVIFALLIALPPAKQAMLIDAARKLDGVPWVMGGRFGQNGVEAIDCQGLVFFALQSISKCGWKSWSVMPTTSVKGELGKPVDGLAPISATALAALLADPAKRGALEPGDVIWFLDPTRNPAEPSIAQLDGVDVWVWHTALYTGDGKFISADPFAGKVVEGPLAPYVAEHEYAGIFVTRMGDGPKPARCVPSTALRRR
jgi:hypothetical protein